MIDLTQPLASGSANRTLAACPVCGADYAANDHRFVVLGVGALKRVGPHAACMSDELSGFMNLFWHEHAQGCASVDIVSDATNGQADLHACSFACMKTLLGGLVDQLEANWQRQRRASTDAPRDEENT